MPEIAVSEDIKAPADKLWALLENFGNLESWWLKESPIKIDHVEVEGQGVGMIRNIYYVNIVAPLSERLDYLDKESKTYKLSIVGEGLPGLISYNATGVVTSTGRDRCRFDYHAKILAIPENEVAVEKTLRFGCLQVVAGLKKAAEA